MNWVTYRYAVIILSICFIGPSCVLASEANDVRKEVFLGHIEKCALLDYQRLLIAQAKVESEMNPFAIGLNSNSRLRSQPESKKQALLLISGLQRSGMNFDVGLLQINSQHFEEGGYLNKMGFDIEDALDGCRSAVMASLILLEAHLRSGHILSALSIYNTGSPVKGISNGYVKSVLKNML